MDISAAGAATQIATQRIQFAQGQIKQNAQTDAQIADLLTQAVAEGQQAAEEKPAGVNIIV